MSETQHSQVDQLSNNPTNVRHFMWNDDYIELLSHRLGLASVKKLVDLGAGLGYLAGLFGLYMKPGSTVYGFDEDPAAIAEAARRAAVSPYSVQFKFEVAKASALPLPDGEADLVLCQHVLAHETAPQAVLAEMCRVARPGGRVVAFEPNSLAQSLIMDSVADDFDLEERMRLVRYQFYYEAGKRALGDGDDSIGDRLPRMFQDAGLTQIEVRLSDKSAALVPPYDTDEKKVRVQELLSWRETFETNRDYIRQCFLKGGGTQAEFEAFTAWELDQNARIQEQLKRECFVHPGGMMTYIVIGTKPL